MEMKLTLTQDKITKGAVRYNDGRGHAIYFRKEELNEPYPKEIEVVISSKEE